MMQRIKEAVYDGLIFADSGKVFKLGLDFHGVIDAEPEFLQLAKILVEHGAEVHILTGSLDTPEFRRNLQAMGMKYTHLFSVSSFHKDAGTKMWYSDPDNPWMDAAEWNKTKADYCREHGINLMIDDSDVYGQHFTTPYLKFRKMPS